MILQNFVLLLVAPSSRLLCALALEEGHWARFSQYGRCRPDPLCDPTKDHGGDCVEETGDDVVGYHVLSRAWLAVALKGGATEGWAWHARNVR